MSRLFLHFKRTFMQLCDKFVRLAAVETESKGARLPGKIKLKELIVCFRPKIRGHHLLNMLKF